MEFMDNVWHTISTNTTLNLACTSARGGGGVGGEAISHKVIHTLCHTLNPIIKIGM